MSEQDSVSNTTSQYQNQAPTTNENDGGNVPAPDAPTHDEHGYKITPETQNDGDIPTPPSAEPTPDESGENDETIEPASTGYSKAADVDGDEPKDDKPEDDKPEEDEPSEEKTEEEYKQEISETVEGLPEGFDKEKVSEFAIKNKFSKEQLEAYVEFAKQEQSLIAERNAEAIKQQREEWQNELANDKEFGGEHFDLNLDKAGKMLKKYMPNTEKVLTERGSMLPPYVMKDLLNWYKTINPTNSLVNGKPPSAEESTSVLDVMYK